MGDVRQLRWPRKIETCPVYDVIGKVSQILGQRGVSGNIMNVLCFLQTLYFHNTYLT